MKTSDILNILASQDFIELMRDMETSQIESKKSSNYGMDFMNRGDFAADFLSALTCIALKDTLSIDGVESLTPCWTPVCETNGNEMAVMFEVVVAQKDTKNPFVFKYESDLPGDLKSHSELLESLNSLVGVAEMVSPYTWNSFMFCGLGNEKFTQKELEDVVKELPFGLYERIISYAEKVYLEKELSSEKAQKPAPKKSKI